MRTLSGAVLATLVALAGACGSGDSGGGAGDSSFAAGSVPSPELPPSCVTWMGAGVVAIVCDPGSRDGSGLSISLGDDSSDGESVGLGIAQMAGEPLTDGERIEFRLDGASPEAVAAFRAMADGLRAEVVIERFDPAARTYTVEVDGRTAHVTTDTGQTRLIQIGDPPPDVRVRDDSPEEAIRSFLALTSHGEVGWRPACELLAESTREAYESSGYPCESLVGMMLVYDEYAEFPEPAGSELGELSVRDGDRVVAEVELTHRYEPGEPDQPREKRVTALVPIAEEDEGWRIVLPNWLSPIRALRGETLPTDAEIEESLRELDDLG